MFDALPIRVVAAAIFDSKNRVLLAKKPATHKNAGKFEFPGGKVQVSESDEEALAREIQEELNLSIRVLDLMGEIKGLVQTREIHLLLYRSELTSGDFEISNLKLSEHESVVWCELERVLSWPLCELDQQIIQTISP
jgi:mutator protein MutT